VLGHRLGNVFPDRARPFDRLRTTKYRGRHLHNFTPNDRMQIACVHVRRNLALESQSLDRPLRARPNLVVVGPVVDNHGVAEGDIGHVERLVDDGHVALGRDDGALESLVSKI
jgi:hypothetical protein